MKKKNKAGGITLPDFKLYQKSMITKTTWYWCKNRHIDQWNRKPRYGPTTACPTNLRQIRKKYPMGKKDSLFNKWCWENWTATRRRKKLDHFLTPHTKIDSKWMKDLNVRQESIKILEENTSSNLFDLGHSNFLLDMSPKARKQRQK